MEIVEKPEKITKDLVAYNKAYRAEHKDYYKKYYETNKEKLFCRLAKIPVGLWRVKMILFDLWNH